MKYFVYLINYQLVKYHEQPESKLQQNFENHQRNRT